MSNELQTRSTSGSHVYAIIRNSARQVWSVAGTAFVTFVDANFANYVYSLTEQGTSGFFSADFPTAITQADTYTIELFQGTGLESDLFVAGGNLAWNGTAASYTPTFGALTTLAYVKDYAGITATTYDGYLQNRIYAASAAIESWTQRTFATTNYTENCDGPSSTTLLLRHNPITALTSVTLDFYGNPTVIPGSEFVINANAGIVSVKPTSTYSRWFPYDYYGGQQNIQVVYSAGYATIPLDVQEACAIMVNLIYINRGRDVTMKSERMLDYNYERFAPLKYLTPDVQALLFKYREIAI